MGWLLLLLLMQDGGLVVAPSLEDEKLWDTWREPCIALVSASSMLQGMPLHLLQQPLVVVVVVACPLALQHRHLRGPGPCLSHAPWRCFRDHKNVTL
jgi:hypothetical protein